MYGDITYELQDFERLFEVDVVAPPGALEETVLSEVDRIKQRLTHEVFTFDDERRLERYIQYHQQALIRLMDKAMVSVYPGAKESHTPENHKILYGGLERLLAFIERHFTKYFDVDAKAPDGYISIARQETRCNRDRLVFMFSRAGANEKITQLILQVLDAVIDSPEDKWITYRKIIYAKEMFREVCRALEAPSARDTDAALREIMWYLNFNSAEVFSYHAHYLNMLLEGAKSRHEKIEKLSFALKTVNQAQVKPGMRYVTENGPLREQLNAYISEEIAYQERMQHLESSCAIRPDHPNFKLKFEASVSQLAFLLRIFIDMRILVNDNLTQVIQFIVKFTVTKRSEIISHGSFRSKYYNVEFSTRQAVRSLLVGMIAYIDGRGMPVLHSKMERSGLKV